MQCNSERHVFEYSETHEYNKPASIGGNCRGFPYGGPGLHTCVCGEKWIEEPELDTEIKPDSMIAKIYRISEERKAQELKDNKWTESFRSPRL
jgi:hypothetical protein